MYETYRHRASGQLPPPPQLDVQGYLFGEFRLSTMMHGFAWCRFPPHHLLEIRKQVIATFLKKCVHLFSFIPCVCRKTS